MFDWLKRMFGFNKKKYVENEKIEVHNSTNSLDSNFVVKPIHAPITPINNKEIIHHKEFIEFSSEDIENIVNIIRPVIKMLNTDSNYIDLCTNLNNSRRLKTYTKLSDDKKTLIITLTQNKIFNELLNDFIVNHVIAKFTATINTEFFGKYEVSASNGSIMIKKIG